MEVSVRGGRMRTPGRRRRRRRRRRKGGGGGERKGRSVREGACSGALGGRLWGEAVGWRGWGDAWGWAAARGVVVRVRARRRQHSDMREEGARAACLPSRASGWAHARVEPRRIDYLKNKSLRIFVTTTSNTRRLNPQGLQRAHRVRPRLVGTRRDEYRLTSDVRRARPCFGEAHARRGRHGKIFAWSLGFISR